ncbi:MAG TPA: glycosyltransferase family 2 protein [Acidimicrobiales bacterium]|nr:glycosyltransferase family 2 protein [Acidimicrobiales bacterium]
MVVLTTVVIVACISYTTALFIRSRRRRPAALPSPPDLFFVFMIPCLNEELVIGASLERLLGLPGFRGAVLVIDDGSDDTTSDIVLGFSSSRVWLLHRSPPDARLGKGAALNAGLRHLQEGELLAGHRSEDVVVAVLDADGRLADNAMFEIAPYFADPTVAAVQVGVRMYNRHTGVLARLQDFEFVTFTEIFQRARQRLGSVGLGGNGQFVRLAALRSLGGEPWTDCLTEDLDLGIRLLAEGWTNAFCPTTHVDQQAVTSMRRLIRQRSRWFQGHLQCWKRIPLVLRAPLSTKSSSDLLYHLTSPALVLAMTFPVIGTLVALTAATVQAPGSVPSAMMAGGGKLFALWYLMSFGVSPFYAFVYWSRAREVSLLRALGLAHLFTLYSYLWLPAGWWAVWRMVRGRSSWAKTARTAELPG